MEGMLNTRPNNYNVGNFQELLKEKKRTIKNGHETTSYCVPHLWSPFLEEINSLTFLDTVLPLISVGT